MKGKVMAHLDDVVRPQLVDAVAIRAAIVETGLDQHDRANITRCLMKSYIVDLDLLAEALAAIEVFGAIPSAKAPPLKRAA